MIHHKDIPNIKPYPSTRIVTVVVSDERGNTLDSRQIEISNTAALLYVREAIWDKNLGQYEMPLRVNDHGIGC